VVEGLSSAQKTNVMLAAMSGDQAQVDQLSPSERAAYEELKGSKGIITVFPTPGEDPTGGKLVNPIPDQNKGITLVTPDQSGEQGSSHTGNTEGKPDIGGSTTVTPIPDAASPSDLIYLNEKIPGLENVRPENPGFPANQDVVNKMNDPKFIEWSSNTNCTDCSDIAPKLLEASGGQGKIIEVRPLKPNTLNVYENGSTEKDMTLHQVYTDGRYVYDPRVSLNPIPKGDWEKHIKAINPDGITISDKLQGLK